MPLLSPSASGIQSCGPWRDTDGDYLDVEAGISFTQAFQDQHGGSDCGLHWVTSPVMV
ncbi:hypothetical protein [Streptomyces sp. NPDC006333]|uniref:hypothetical protein n=1 Tax=Streptomyces sp. NPDC006333 TaxID=3156753 RepID=UPI0033A577F6